MSHINGLGILLRFLLGGGSVAAAYLLGKLIGGRFGGIFAAFPGVYLASIISLGAGLPEAQANSLVLQVSKGALIGMGANVIAAIAAGRFVPTVGYRKGLCYALVLWSVLATCVVLLTRLR